MKATTQGEFKGKQGSLGVILVLFILLVIVSHVFDQRPEPPQQDVPIGVATSRGFDVYNESTFTLTTTGLFGDFEKKPAPHTILPGGSYNYQVSTNLYKTSIVNVYYSYEYRQAGQTRTGTLIVDMIADTNGVNQSTAYIRLYTTGPLNYYRPENYSSKVYIRN
ncbi:hypothetical protein M3223_14680 [Paenibacillus pasadenensis]|uniref:hypothetical protein n=1 Tax=Paenibacillus pasadenensis TaxID=217090 RepID=UPI00203D7AA6|nr:hypothetical protein [Paenibacillus pasadenensis]MCM3748594.1 hypothetical protein [Paenibacillus pasadenensis]